MGKGKNGLPDRWLDYVSIGQEIRGVPIIACKVPLREDMLRVNLRQEQWFTPDILVEMVPNVGCIVDLTATNRYYNPQVFMERGIHHEKIFCEGHVIPKPTTVQRFFQVVDEFLHSVDSRGKVLMVHCTHGLNRTGYLVSRYMVERRGFLPADAIAAFNEARGHCIERANYLEDLYTRDSCTDPVPLFQKSGPRAGYHDNYQAGPDYHQQEEYGTASNVFNRYGGHARRSGPNDQQQPFTNYRGPQHHYPPPSYNARPSGHHQSERYATGASQSQQPSNNWRQGQDSGNRSHGHPSPHVQHVNQQSITRYQGRTNSPLPAYDGRQKHANYYNVPPPDVPTGRKHIRFPDSSSPSSSIDDRSNSQIDTPVQMNNVEDRPNSANRNRSKASVQQPATKCQDGNHRPISPSVQIAGKLPKNPSVSSTSSSKIRDRSRNRRDVPDDQSTSSIEICYDSRRKEPEFRPPPTRENRRHERGDPSAIATGQELGSERRSGKKMRHKTAKRLKEASNGGPSTDLSSK